MPRVVAASRLDVIFGGRRVALQRAVDAAHDRHERLRAQARRHHGPSWRVPERAAAEIDEARRHLRLAEETLREFEERERERTRERRTSP